MGKIADAIRGLSLPQQKQTQMLYLDSEFEKLEAERDALKLENRDLQAQVKPLQQRVERLEAQLKERASNKDKNVVHEKLDDIEESLLSYVASVRKENCTTKKIADAIKRVHPGVEYATHGKSRREYTPICSGPTRKGEGYARSEANHFPLRLAAARRARSDRWAFVSPRQLALPPLEPLRRR